MGKVKRARNKASKVTSSSTTTDIKQIETPAETFQNITFNKLKNSLMDCDTRSVRSFKSIKSEVAGEKQMSKKDKMKLRHELFLHKIDTTIKSRAASRKRDKKLRKAISGNMLPLYDALPSLNSLLKPKDTPVTKNINEPKPKAIQKTSTRQKQMKSQKELFKKLMEHPTFKANPREAIASHIQATLSQ